MDVILSSGFLAFARHVGFLQAVEAASLAHPEARPQAIVGTSSGAVVGALYAAGLSVSRIAALLSEAAPIRDLVFLPRWRARTASHRMPLSLFGAQGAERRLRCWLPASFEELPIPLYAGVQNDEGEYELLHRGPLVEALLASFAVPGLLSPVAIDGRLYSDGGAVDRTGVEPWRILRPGRRAIVHEVARSHGAHRSFSTQGIVLVRSPRARASLLSLRDFYRQMEETRAISSARVTAGSFAQE